jgi:hypothetical protein
MKLLLRKAAAVAGLPATGHRLACRIVLVE